jgi:hypothetical protein
MFIEMVFQNQFEEFIEASGTTFFWLFFFIKLLLYLQNAYNSKSPVPSLNALPFAPRF